MLLISQMENFITKKGGEGLGLELVGNIESEV